MIFFLFKISLTLFVLGYGESCSQQGYGLPSHEMNSRVPVQHQRLQQDPFAQNPMFNEILANHPSNYGPGFGPNNRHRRYAQGPLPGNQQNRGVTENRIYSYVSQNLNQAEHEVNYAIGQVISRRGSPAIVQSLQSALKQINAPVNTGNYVLNDKIQRALGKIRNDLNQAKGILNGASRMNSQNVLRKLDSAKLNFALLRQEISRAVPKQSRAMKQVLQGPASNYMQNTSWNKRNNGHYSNPNQINNSQWNSRNIRAY